MIVDYDEPKIIPGFNDYMVNRNGKVFDKNGNEIKPYHYDDNEHYDCIYMHDNVGKHHVVGVHRLVALTFNPNFFPGCVVHHKDENKYNNNIDNLEVMTQAEHAKGHKPGKYFNKIAICEVCGRRFIWTAKRQGLYCRDLNRNKSRIIACSRACSSYYGRMIQLGIIKPNGSLSQQAEETVPNTV